MALLHSHMERFQRQKTRRRGFSFQVRTDKPPDSHATAEVGGDHPNVLDAKVISRLSEVPPLSLVLRQNLGSCNKSQTVVTPTCILENTSPNSTSPRNELITNNLPICFKLKRIRSGLRACLPTWTKLVLVNLGFFMSHIYLSETEHLSVVYTETNVPWFPKMIGPRLARILVDIFHNICLI